MSEPFETLELIGDDATIEGVVFGTEKIGDGVKSLDELAGGAAASGKGKGEWRVTAKAAAGSVFGELAIGDLFLADGDEVPVAGDKAKQLTCTPFLDASGFDIGFEAKEVEITLQKHRILKYRKGKSDATGNIKGIYTLGVTGESGGLTNQFLRIVKKAADGSVTVSAVNSHPIYIRGVIRDTKVSGTTFAFVFGQIELFGLKMGSDPGSKQEYSSKFRFTGDDPVYYEREIV